MGSEVPVNLDLSLGAVRSELKGGQEGPEMRQPEC